MKATKSLRTTAVVYVCIHLKQTIFKFFAHDGTSGGWHVVGRILLGICRCDNRHQMVPVRWVYLGPKQVISQRGFNIKYVQAFILSLQVYLFIKHGLTRGSQTGRFKLLSSGCFKSTGFGHSLMSNKQIDTLKCTLSNISTKSSNYIPTNYTSKYILWPQFIRDTS